jgi:PadR family transcriptional regulator PadR
MSRKEKRTAQLLQGTLDLMVLRTLETMGPQHAYQIASRLEQVSDRLLELNQGTLYPALVRLEQYGWIKGCWGKTQNNREAKFYTVSRTGRKALAGETTRWRTRSDLVERLLVEGTRA